MTMLDDNQLAGLLARAGEAFEVPASGAAEIVARATGAGAGDDDGSADDGAVTGRAEDPDEVARGRADRLRRASAAAGRHRVLSVAACLVVLLVAVGLVGALTRSPAPTRLTSGAPATAPVHPPSRSPAPPTTTLPAPGSTAAGAPLKGAAGAEGQGFSAASGTSTPAVTVPSSPSLPHDAVGQSSKIEQTGTLGLRVRRGELARTMTQLGTLAGSVGGFVANSQTQSGSGGAPYGSITLQVPVSTFSSVLKQAQALGTTSALSTHATDVTGQYVDLQARISALQTSEQQYLTILSRATTVGDVLSVQEQIDTIQSQIEQLQGQLQLLTSQTAYSTLTVTLNEPSAPTPPGPLPESGVVRAWHTSVNGFLAGVDGVVRLAGPVLFALLCLAVLLVGGRWAWRRYQRHNL